MFPCVLGSLVADCSACVRTQIALSLTNRLICAITVPLLTFILPSMFYLMTVDDTRSSIFTNTKLPAVCVLLGGWLVMPLLISSWALNHEVYQLGMPWPAPTFDSQ